MVNPRAKGYKPRGVGTTYKQSGVDIEAGDALVERIKPHAARTRRSEVLSGVGGFGGLFAIPPGKYKEPILVSGTDGVGTKLKLAFAMDQHETVGIDLVAMSVNDVLTSGAEPLFFLDYFATARLDVERAEKVIAGVAKGCELAGCTLLGGETAELPGIYREQELDFAGTCVGLVERDRFIDGSRIAAGDVVIGLASAGIHANGFTLVRRLIGDGDFDADLILPPTRLYLDEVRALRARADVRGLAHITGGGIPGNLSRVFPAGSGLGAVIDPAAWAWPEVFRWIASHDVPLDEMRRVFNLGIGYCAVLPAADVRAGDLVIGRVESGVEGVVFA